MHEPEKVLRSIQTSEPSDQLSRRVSEIQVAVPKDPANQFNVSSNWQMVMRSSGIAALILISFLIGFVCGHQKNPPPANSVSVEDGLVQNNLQHKQNFKEPTDLIPFRSQTWQAIEPDQNPLNEINVSEIEPILSLQFEFPK